MALNGDGEDNIFYGTIFADEIFGFGGDDYIHGSRGADTIDGGSDSDTVDYLITVGFAAIPVESGAVSVDLEQAVQAGGLAEGDVLIDIENISGSAVNDSIRGDSEVNDIRGNGGDDVIEGREGDDVLVGDGSLFFSAVLKATMTSMAAAAKTFLPGWAETIR